MWIYKPMEHIEPQEIYNQQDICELLDPPTDWVETLNFPATGEEVLRSGLTYASPVGSPRKVPLAKRTVKRQLVFSKSQWLFLRSLRRETGMDIGVIIRLRCLGHGIRLEHASNVDLVIRMEVLIAALSIRSVPGEDSERLMDSLKSLHSYLSNKYMMIVPDSLRPKEKPRQTVRFSVGEFAMLNFKGTFSKYVWQKISEYPWFRVPRVSDEHFQALVQLFEEIRHDIDFSGNSIFALRVEQLTKLIRSIKREYPIIDAEGCTIRGFK